GRETGGGRQQDGRGQPDAPGQGGPEGGPVGGHGLLAQGWQQGGHDRDGEHAVGQLEEDERGRVGGVAALDAVGEDRDQQVAELVGDHVADGVGGQGGHLADGLVAPV